MLRGARPQGEASKAGHLFRVHVEHRANSPGIPRTSVGQPSPRGRGLRLLKKYLSLTRTDCVIVGPVFQVKTRDRERPRSASLSVAEPVHKPRRRPPGHSSSPAETTTAAS